MATKPLTVAVPEALLKRIRGGARRSKRTVEAEVIQLLTAAVAAEDVTHANGSADRTVQKKPPRTSLADWAEENAEDWGDRINSENVESFTGRRF
ncbi:MAG TPA: hypothetical protein VHR66_06740 [Gemmataceae bacterium]|nr:hypothetical protein [Gemmataceae bacterium]